MDARVDRQGLKVAEALDRFITDEAIPGTGVDPETFWRGFSRIVETYAPRARCG